MQLLKRHIKLFAAYYYNLEQLLGSRLASATSMMRWLFGAEGLWEWNAAVFVQRSSLSLGQTDGYRRNSWGYTEKL